MLTLENFSEKSFWNQKMDTSDTIKHNAVNGTISSWDPQVSIMFPDDNEMNYSAIMNPLYTGQGTPNQ